MDLFLKNATIDSVNEAIIALSNTTMYWQIMGLL